MGDLTQKIAETDDFLPFWISKTKTRNYHLNSVKQTVFCVLRG